MSLNTAHANGGVLIFNTERILVYYDGVEVSFEMEENQPHFKGHKKGKIYLTTHRVIFISNDKKDAMQSFSMPFFTLKKLELEQPVFGANYIKGKVKAEPGGNWNGEGKFKLWFNHGGAIEFGQAMLQAGKLAQRNYSPQPPVYEPPTAPYYMAPPPAYAPPSGPLYGFVPHQAFPFQPPADGVFMYDAPPPYAGIDPNLTPFQAQAQPMFYNASPGHPNAPPNYGAAYPSGEGYSNGFPNSAASAPIYAPYAYPPQASPFQSNAFQQGPESQDSHRSAAAAAKEAEALGANGGYAYYDANNQHSVYMPPPPYAPDDRDKKND